MATAKSSSTTKRTSDTTARPKIGSSHAGTKKTGAKKGAKKSATLPARASAPAPRPKKKAAPAAASGKRAARPTATREGPAPRARAEKSVAAAPERSVASEAAAQLALAIAAAALDKKAVNVQIVDVVGRVDYADYLVVMSGRSDRHVLSVADSIEDALVRMTPKRKPVSVEGRPQGHWVVLDFGDVVAHVFQEEARSFYDLDALWEDARRVPVPVDAARA